MTDECFSCALPEHGCNQSALFAAHLLGYKSNCTTKRPSLYGKILARIVSTVSSTMSIAPPSPTSPESKSLAPVFADLRPPRMSAGADRAYVLVRILWIDMWSEVWNNITLELGANAGAASAVPQSRIDKKAAGFIVFAGRLDII